ncbi:muramoyltetrapeptide carboxypeptidase [Undibacterium arcticum]|uniref:Muramoyltetrapeptide carboxypeptidase n=1 Tax=Undibacterium arcticum TaxID=1762892 RepID=A0ABV7F424_9BURK
MSNNKIGIAIVAPAGFAPDPAALQRGIAALEAQGCRVHNYYDPAEKFQRFGGTDAARLAQFHAAAADPEVQIVMALRGGYGLSRLLPVLDYNLLAESGKLFVGHSDLTAFQMALLKHTGAVSFSGPMLCDDFAREAPSDFMCGQFWQCLIGPTHAVTNLIPQNNPALEVSGTLWGGNLTMLTHLVGTPYMPQVDGGILFVEDVSEHPYRVERMLLQLLYSGVLARQKAVLLGDFSNYRLGDFDNGYDFDAMLAYFRAQSPVPVLTGLPFGHVRDKATLAVGCQATLRSDTQNWQLTMRGYPVLEC